MARSLAEHRRHSSLTLRVLAGRGLASILAAAPQTCLGFGYVSRARTAVNRCAKCVAGGASSCRHVACGQASVGTWAEAGWRRLLLAQAEVLRQSSQARQALATRFAFVLPSQRQAARLCTTRLSASHTSGASLQARCFQASWPSARRELGGLSRPLEGVARASERQDNSRRAHASGGRSASAQVYDWVLVDIRGQSD